MKTELWFSREQQEDFLKRRGYIFEKVMSWRTVAVGYWDEHEDCEITIVYKEGNRPSEAILSRDVYDICNFHGFGVTQVFRQELHNALLNL